MNSTINLNNRTYRENTSTVKAVCANVICIMLSFLDGVLELLSRPLVSLFIKGSMTVITLVVILGAAGGIEAGTLTFAQALIRIVGSCGITLLVFKGISE